MHIGVLTHNYPRYPGDFSGTFVEALCQEFVRQDQQVTVWAPFDLAYHQTKRGGERGKGGKGESPLSTLHSPLSEQSAIRNPNLRLFRYAFPDRLHTLGYMRSMQSDLSLKLSNYALSPFFFAAGITTLLRQARRLRVDVLHAHWLLPNGFIAAVAARQLGIPLVISVPGSDAQVANANPLFRLMARFAMRQTSLLTANSAELRDAVIEIGAQRFTEKSERETERKQIERKFDLILYGTDPNALKPDSTGVDVLRESWRSGGKGRTPDGLQKSPISNLQSPISLQPAIFLLCVGRMVYKKGFDTLLRAMAEPALRQREVIAIMIGNGDQKSEWQALAEQLGINQRVRWVGNVPKTEIGVYYNACDLLVNPSVSRPADGLNVCVLDAMSCGKPVVGSNVAGNPLAIIDGATGLIVPEQDAPALAGALARLVDDAELRQQMGQAARQRIETELGWPHLARRYLEHFQRLTTS